jgi:hypothetical protein
VRSKGERVVADHLTHHNIAYKYEAEASTKDWFIFKSRMSRPDFYLLHYNLYVEYWGLLDVRDRRTKG